MAEAVEQAQHVFISYVREDSAEVDRLEADLQKVGIQVWRDTNAMRPGDDWRARIRGAISGNTVIFLACFSSRGLARDKSYQREELTLAIEELRQRSPEVPWLIPIRLDDCTMPDMSIGAGRTLRSLERADLFGERREAELSRLVFALGQVLGRRLRDDGAELRLESSEMSANPAVLPRPRSGIPRRRQVALGVFGSVALACIGLTVWLLSYATASPESSKRSHDIGSVATTSVQTPGITAAVSRRYYRIILPVDDTHASDQQLQQIDLIMTFPGPACAEVPVILYQVQNPITVARHGELASGSISAQSGYATGFAVPAAGRLNFGCGLDQLHLRFLPPGLILKGLTTTAVIIDVPRQLRVNYQYLPTKEPLRTRVLLPNVDDKGIYGIDFMAFRIIAVISNGNRLDSCFVLKGESGTARQGLLKCNSTVEGWKAFRPIE